MVGRDYEPLVPARKRKDDEVAFNHVRKKQLKTKGLEIVFDPAKHRDFITGFRKRKQQRRKDAQDKIKIQERKLRLENRAEKRAKLKQDLGLDDNWGVSSDEDQKAWKKRHKQQGGAGAEEGSEGSGSDSSDSEEEAQPEANKDANVAVYEQQGTRTIVTTAPLSLYSESDQGSDGDADGEGEADHDDDNEEEEQQQQQHHHRRAAAPHKQQRPAKHKASGKSRVGDKKGSKGVHKKGSKKTHEKSGKH